MPLSWVYVFSVLCAFKKPINIHHLLCSFFPCIRLFWAKWSCILHKLPSILAPTEQEYNNNFHRSSAIHFIYQTVHNFPSTFIHFRRNIFIFPLFFDVFLAFTSTCRACFQTTAATTEASWRERVIPHVVPTLTIHLHVLSRALINQNTRDLIIYHAKQLVNCHIKMLCMSTET